MQMAPYDCKGKSGKKQGGIVLQKSALPFFRWLWGF